MGGGGTVGGGVHPKTTVAKDEKTKMSIFKCMSRNATYNCDCSALGQSQDISLHPRTS